MSYRYTVDKASVIQELTFKNSSDFDSYIDKMKNGRFAFELLAADHNADGSVIATVTRSYNSCAFYSLRGDSAAAKVAAKEVIRSFCKDQICDGECSEDDCEFCPVNSAWNLMFET